MKANNYDNHDDIADEIEVSGRRGLLFASSTPGKTRRRSGVSGIGKERVLHGK